MAQVIRVPPDLAMEVLSRSTEARDRGRKMGLFARFGVPEYWIVDPVRNTLEIDGLEAGEYALKATCREHGRVQSPTLTGLMVNADRIFLD